VSSDIVANLPGMLPGTNPGDYMPADDAHFETMEVYTLRFRHWKPLVKRRYSSKNDDAKIP